LKPREVAFLTSNMLIRSVQSLSAIFPFCFLLSKSQTVRFFVSFCFRRDFNLDWLWVSCHQATIWSQSEAQSYKITLSLIKKCICKILLNPTPKKQSHFSLKINNFWSQRANYKNKQIKLKLPNHDTIKFVWI